MRHHLLTCIFNSLKAIKPNSFSRRSFPKLFFMVLVKVVTWATWVNITALTSTGSNLLHTHSHSSSLHTHTHLSVHRHTVLTHIQTHRKTWGSDDSGQGLGQDRTAGSSFTVGVGVYQMFQREEKHSTLEGFICWHQQLQWGFFLEHGLVLGFSYNEIITNSLT